MASAVRICSDGTEAKVFSILDGMGIKRLNQAGIAVAWISGRASGATSVRATELRVPHLIQGRTDKLNALNELLAATGIDQQEVCYAGDDWLDIPVLNRVGLAVTVADADAVVRQHAHWITSRPGGQGAVREICDLILAAQGLDQRVLDGILGQ